MAGQKTSVLTQTQRDSLKSDFENDSPAGKRAKRSRIKGRTKQSLVDYGILNENLSDSDLQDIFGEADMDQVISVLEFIYRGMYMQVGDESEFTRALQRAVARAERKTENVDDESLATCEFRVHRALGASSEDIADLIEDGSYNTLESPELLSFLRSAKERNAIDFDSFRD
jgi:Flp pilus assembly CpaF family ATPase